MRAAQAEATRAALVGAARTLFGAKGFADTSLEDLTREAGVTKGALYHHFVDKVDVFRAVVEQVQLEVVTAAAEAAHAVDGDAWQVLVTVCDAYLERCLDPDILRILVTDAPAVIGWRDWCTIDKRFGVDLLREPIERAIAAGELAEQAVESLAFVLLGTLNTSARVVAQSGDGDGDTAAARAQVGATVDRLLSGLRRSRR